ncbi:MAG: hypothetical protein AAGI15_17555 [Pseudomonadota bacterium]
MFDSVKRAGLTALVTRENSALLMAAAVAMAASLAVLASLLATFETAFVGMVLVTQAFPLLVHQIVNLKSWQSFTREATPPLRAGDRLQVAALTQAYFRVDLGCALLGGSIALLLVGAASALFGWPEAWRGALYAFAGTVFINFSSFSFAVFRLLRATRAQSFATVLLPLGQLLLLGLFARSHPGASAFLAAWLTLTVASYVITLALAVIALQSQGLGGWWRARPPAGNRAWASSLWINAATSLDAIVKQADLLLVSALLSVDAVPGYRLLKQSGAALYRFADVIAQTSFSRLLTLLDAGDESGARRLLRSGSLSCIAASAGAVVVLVLAMPLWLPLFGEVGVASRAPLTAYLVIVVIAVGGTLLHQLVYALGYLRMPVLTTAVAVGVFLVTAVAAAPELGVWAFIAAFALYHAVALTGKALLLRARTPRDPPAPTHTAELA